VSGLDVIYAVYRNVHRLFSKERFKFEAVGVCPDGKFIETTLNMSFDDTDTFRPITDKEIVYIE